MNPSVFTVGHSTHSAEHFRDLLTRNSITAVADVRSVPFSRMHPHFNRESLQASLKRAGIAYVFLGRELGARSEDPRCYVAGKVQYERLAQTSSFQTGIERVRRGAETHRIVLLCAEKDPLTCHRCILVARHLTAHGLSVEHILGDGKLESHDAAVRRLLSELQMEQNELFHGNRSLEEAIAEAYRRREDRIAYVTPTLSSEASLTWQR